MKEVGLGMALALAAFAAAAQQPQLPFPVAVAEVRTVDREAMVDATIEAVHQSTISAQTSGRVQEVNFDVDDFVGKGEVVLRIRDTEQKAALQAAEARFEEANAEFKRVQELYRKKLVSKSVYDKTQAALKAARANRAQAREQLDHTVVRAPFSGIVVERHVEVGETANPGQPLMTGLSLEKLRATARLPQVHVGAVRQSGAARVILPGSAGSVPGAAVTVSPYADPTSHTFGVRVDLPDGQHGVYPGMFAKVAFTVGQDERLLVPAAAVVRRSEVMAVYVVSSDDRVRFRQVRVGRTLDNGMVEILAGLEPGERVATDPIRAGVYLKQNRAGERS